MAYLEDEPAAERVAEIMADVHEDGVPLLMTAVNAGEIWYIIARRTNAGKADRTIKLLQDIGIEFIEADWPLAKIAAGFMSERRSCSPPILGGVAAASADGVVGGRGGFLATGFPRFADCFAAALAKQNKATLVTGDREFAQLENEIAVLWAARPEASFATRFYPKSQLTESFDHNQSGFYFRRSSTSLATPLNGLSSLLTS